MTHTLHRQGSAGDAGSDYVVIAMASHSVPQPDVGARFGRFLDIALAHSPVAFGDMHTGNELTHGAERLRAGFSPASIVHAVFTESASVSAMLAALKEADLGLSIVVSGLLETTSSCCRDVGLTPHTEARSLGIHGRTKKLPRESVLKIGTLCGHGMVGAPLIDEMTRRVRDGVCSPEEAATELARQCRCGVFNPARAASLLRAASERPAV